MADDDDGNEAEHRIPAQLREMARMAVDGSEPASESVRVLLSWFSAQRRGAWVTETIRNALGELALRTEPDFADVGIDTPVQFISTVPQQASSEPPDTPSEPAAAPSSVVDDAVPRVGMLASANHPPVTTTRDATVVHACSVMVANDYSQLPVVNGRNIVGMFSWKSLGEARSVGGACEFVRDCMTRELLIVEPSKPLLDAVEQIAQREVALIVQHGELLGIITTTDLSLQFHSTTRPFLLIGSIENQLRGILSGLPLDVLRSVRAEGERSLSSVHDMSFGEYVRLLQREEVWRLLAPGLDRGTIVSLLDEIREIRNDVMHFHPDPVGDVQIRRLQNGLRLLHMMRASASHT